MPVDAPVINTDLTLVPAAGARRRSYPWAGLEDFPVTVLDQEMARVSSQTDSGAERVASRAEARPGIFDRIAQGRGDLHIRVKEKRLRPSLNSPIASNPCRS